jgi:type I restriction enzyme S subunit
MIEKFPLVDIAALEEQGAITEIQDGNHGERHPKVGDYVEDGIPFIMANDLTDGFVNLSACSRISEQQARGLRIGFSTIGDVLLSHKGTLGNVALVTEADPFIMLTPQVTYYRTDNSRLLNRFLVYAFREAGFQARMHAVGAQGTRPYVGITAQRRLQIVFPSHDIQVRITDVLSAYDDLIENNRRRMELLEEAARQLYREWFVRLRFPGREHTRVIDGVPEGWERKTLADLCESIDYGYTASAEKEEVGPKFLRITDIVPTFIDWFSVPYCQIEEDRLSKFRLSEGDIVIARTGATVGYAKRLHKRHPEAVFASYLVRLRLKSDVDNLVVGVFVESEDYKAYIKSRVGGAAQPNANAKVLAGAEILVPPPTLQRAFREFAEPLVDQHELLQVQNEKVRAARDLLLPKLMDGEIAV